MKRPLQIVVTRTGYDVGISHLFQLYSSTVDARARHRLEAVELNATVSVSVAVSHSSRIELSSAVALK